MALVHDVLADLQALLSEHDIVWYVFGAQAVVVYGQPRQTADVDVTVALPLSEVASFVNSLQEHGFTVAVDDIETFARRTRVIPLVHNASGIPVDVILASPGLEDEFLARAAEFDIGTTRVPFISPEDLVAIKVLAGRRKDLEDVRGIVEKQGESLDDARIRDVLERFEQSLDRSDLVATYDSLGRNR